MARILISSGPTRQFLDPVRYLTNASSGRMGRGLATAALAQGHDVIVVSGPVSISYPPMAKVIPIVTTDEMLSACESYFSHCDGFIGAAAPCDYQPIRIAQEKIQKTGEPLVLQLVETADVVATLGQQKKPEQWIVGFALETQDARFRALAKLQKKCCDLVVINGPEAMDAPGNSVEIIDHDGKIVARFRGNKNAVASAIMAEIGVRLLESG